MHELSMCESIYTIVDRTAAGRPVTVTSYAMPLTTSPR